MGLQDFQNKIYNRNASNKFSNTRFPTHSFIGWIEIYMGPTKFMWDPNDIQPTWNTDNRVSHEHEINNNQALSH